MMKALALANGRLLRPRLWLGPQFAARRALSISALEDRPPDKLITVKFDDGTAGTWPYNWLRDNSPDPSTYHMGENMRGRLLRMYQVPSDIAPLDVRVSNDGGALCVVWPPVNGEPGSAPPPSPRADAPTVASRYTADWLRRRNMASPEFRQVRVDQLHGRQGKLWTAEGMADSLSRAHYEQLVDGPATRQSRLRLLQGFLDYGLALVDGVPRRPEQLEHLRHLFGHVHATHYGTVFSVRAESSPTNLAYTSHALGLHTDLTFYTHQPDIQALLVIEQSARGGGGESTFADGIAAALHMKAHEPELYDALVSIPFECIDYGRTQGTEHLLILKRTAIDENGRGLPRLISYSGQHRGWFVDASSPRDVHRLYAAMKRYDELLHSDRFRLQLRLESGTLAVFDNWRVLHGRAGFNNSNDDSVRVNATRPRELAGCFYTWDMVLSNVAVLRRQLGQLPHASVDDGT